MVEKEQINTILTEIIESENNNKSYSHKPHLAELPYDHNTNDVEKLKERRDVINELIFFLEPELKAMKNDLKKKETELKETEKEFNKTKKEFGKELVDSYNNWKDYKDHFESGEFEYIGIDYEYGFNGWTDSYYNKVKKEVSAFDKRVEDMLKIDFDNITNEDYKEMSKLNSDITNFMKRNYDNKSPSMETNVWFQYSDIFGQPSDTNMPLTLLKNGVETKEKLDTLSSEVESLSKDYDKQSTIYQDYKTEYERTNAHIDKVTN